MHFSGIKPKHILDWIKRRDNGDDTDYLKGKEDTQEAIGVFRSLYDYTFKTPYRLFQYLEKYLCMRIAKSQSFYRAFIVLNNDEIITLRLSQHFATQNSTNSAKERQGKPNVEYHLVINRMQSVNPKKDIYYDRVFEDIEIMVRDIDLAEFNDGHFRKGIIDEIIALLTNGTTPSSMDENKQYRKMNLTESRLRSIIRESIDTLLLIESQESKSIDAAKNLVMQRNGCTKEEADEFVRIKIRNKFPILHYKKPAKFILGVTRMYLDGQLENRRIASKLYGTISYISTNEYYEQYDRNLNNLSAEEFINEFYPSIKNDLNTDKENIKQFIKQLKNTNLSNDYYVVKIDSFEQAEKYSEYCEWCICEDEGYYDDVGGNGLWQLYFLLKKRFENIKYNYDEVDFDNNYMTANLFDEYGMSMIAIYVDEEGQLVICKNRHNDDILFDTSCILTTRQITELIGKDFYEVFKPKESNGFATNESISKYDRIISESIRNTLHKLL